VTADKVPNPAIHVLGLEKSYGELHVLRGVDFDVTRGSIFALLGSNGAGKTTVVNILSRSSRPMRGPSSSAASMSPHVPRMYGSRSASPGSSRPSMRSSAGGRTS